MSATASSAPAVSLGRATGLQADFRCPVCHGGLQGQGEAGFRCLSCGEHYPLLQGRPVLMSPASRAYFDLGLSDGDGRRMVEEYAAAPGPARPSAWRRWLGWLRPPDIMHRYYPDPARGPGAPLFEKAGPEVRLLNVGGGPYRVSAQEITLNIGPFPGVDLIADAHEIPLADGSVDAIFSLAVLEHVTDPKRVASEMMRVLKPGGWLYSEAPFIFFFHGYPADFTRFTRDGLARLFTGLEAVEVGMTHGPVSAVLQSGNMALQLVVPERPALIRKLFNGVYRWLLFPFKYLDIPLQNHPQAHILAGGFYIRGRKPVAEPGQGGQTPLEPAREEA
ncbi:MAG: methyltransferase domain-containing protein [Pseudomonadota bacterium]